MAPENVKQHLSPGKILYGPGSIDTLADELPPEHAYMIVTDPGVAGAGILQKLKTALENAGLETRVFDRVSADPPIEVVEEGVQECRRNGCDAVIGLGGGSSLDAAKGVAVRLKAPGTLREYGDGPWVPGPVAPLYAVPTTAGTGSEVTRVAVITDLAKKEKMAIRGEYLAPRIAALDPELLAGLPPRIAAETGADALTHAVEAYMSLASGPISDTLAIGAIQMVMESLRAMVANPADTATAEKMLLASCMAGQAFSNASVTLAHALGEILGSFFHVPHGLSCALYLPVVMDFNRPAQPERFFRMARAMGVDTSGMDKETASEAASGQVRRLFKDIGLPLTFAEAGIDFELNDEMVEGVWPQYCTRCNPRKPTASEVESLFWGPKT